MAEIRHLENRHDVIFLCWGWSDLNKLSQTGAKWHVDCGDVVDIETRRRIPIWRTFGRIPWHVIPEPPATLQGAATWWIHCHDSRATCRSHIAGCSHLAKSKSWSCRIAGCNNSIRHIENRFSPYFIFFVFNAVWALTSGGFRIVSDTLVFLEKWALVLVSFESVATYVIRRNVICRWFTNVLTIVSVIRVADVSLKHYPRLYATNPPPSVNLHTDDPHYSDTWRPNLLDTVFV